MGKNLPLVLAWWAILGEKKGRVCRLCQCKLCDCTHSVHHPEKAWSSPRPPRSQLKFVTEMSTSGHSAVLPSCISLIWCWKRRCSPFCLWGSNFIFHLHISYVVLCSWTQIFQKLSTLKAPVRIILDSPFFFLCCVIPCTSSRPLVSHLDEMHQVLMYLQCVKNVQMYCLKDHRSSLSPSLATVLQQMNTPR